MSHRLDPTRDLLHERVTSNEPWIALLLFLLLIAVIVAFMAPSRAAAPPAVAPAPSTASAENPELGAFARFQAAQQAELRAALMTNNPELRAVDRYQAAQDQLLHESPELNAFWRQRKH